MVGTVRAMIVAVLALGLALAIAPRDAPTTDGAQVGTADEGVGLAAFDWTIDAPDFVEPGDVEVPAQPAPIVAPASWIHGQGAAAVADVLGNAPKTSPPLA